IEPPTALDHLGHAVDGHDLLVKLAFLLLAALTTSHRPSPSFPAGFTRSKFKARLAGAVGQSLDPAVVQVAAPVEDDLADAGLQGPLADEPAHFPRRVHVAGLGQPAAELRIEGRRGDQGLAGVVADDLGVDVLQAAEHRQERARGRGLDAATRLPAVAARMIWA